MYKKEIHFEDLDGNPTSEVFYFNLSRAELAEMEMFEEGGMKARLETIIASNDPKQIVTEFKKLILASHGQRSGDNKHFIKNEEITQMFAGTDAYSELLYEMYTNANAAAEFMNGIVPKQPQDHKNILDTPLPIEDVKPADDLVGKSVEELREMLRARPVSGG
jgi:hypothetical protein